MMAVRKEKVVKQVISQSRQKYKTGFSKRKLRLNISQRFSPLIHLRIIVFEIHGLRQ